MAEGSQFAIRLPPIPSTLGATRTNNASAHSAALGLTPSSLVRGHRQAKSKNVWVVANLVNFMETWTRHIPQVLTNMTRILAAYASTERDVGLY